MPDRRFSSRRRELQQQMEKASSRVVRSGKELERALEAWTKAAHEVTRKAVEEPCPKS